MSSGGVFFFFCFVYCSFFFGSFVVEFSFGERKKMAEKNMFDALGEEEEEIDEVEEEEEEEEETQESGPSSGTNKKKKKRKNKKKKKANPQTPEIPTELSDSLIQAGNENTISDEVKKEASLHDQLEIGALTEEQKDLVKKLKEKVLGEKESLPVGEGHIRAWLEDSQAFKRFLIARSWDLEEAFKMICGAILWRNEYKVFFLFFFFFFCFVFVVFGGGG